VYNVRGERKNMSIYEYNKLALEEELSLFMELLGNN
jgi:hypothetical protein